MHIYVLNGRTVRNISNIIIVLGLVIDSNIYGACTQDFHPSRQEKYFSLNIIKPRPDKLFGSSR